MPNGVFKDVVPRLEFPPTHAQDQYLRETDLEYRARKEREADEERARVVELRLGRLEGVRVYPQVKQAIANGTLHHGGSDALPQVHEWLGTDLTNAYKPVLVLAGRTGVGKTVAAAAALADLGGEFLKATQLLVAMRDHSDHYEMQRRLRTSRLVVVDDIGTERDPDALGSALYELIDSRLDDFDRRTLLTTNLTPEQLFQRLDERTADRLRELSKWAVVRHRQSLREGSAPPRGITGGRA